MVLTKLNPTSWFTPSMPRVEGVSCLSTYRFGGASTSPFESLNLGLHVGDIEASVIKNRLSLPCPKSIAWLNQTHSNTVVNAVDVINNDNLLNADACWTNQPNLVCGIMTADCLPVLLIDKQQKKIAAVHCGWRGLQQKIMTQTLLRMKSNPSHIQVWLGPAIGPCAFEVGVDVKNAFSSQYQDCFQGHSSLSKNKFFADVYQIATLELNLLGIHKSIYKNDECTYSNPERYFSYRRDGVTGRMASLIWLHN